MAQGTLPSLPFSKPFKCPVFAHSSLPRICSPALDAVLTLLATTYLFHVSLPQGGLLWPSSVNCALTLSLHIEQNISLWYINYNLWLFVHLGVYLIVSPYKTPHEGMDHIFPLTVDSSWNMVSAQFVAAEQMNEYNLGNTYCTARSSRIVVWNSGFGCRLCCLLWQLWDLVHLAYPF